MRLQGLKIRVSLVQRRLWGTNKTVDLVAPASGPHGPSMTMVGYVVTAATRAKACASDYSTGSSCGGISTIWPLR
jgi:hypothetical protein